MIDEDRGRENAPPPGDGPAPPPVEAPGVPPPHSEPESATRAKKRRWQPPDFKPSTWLIRHRAKLQVLEWGATVFFALLALYFLWLLLFSSRPTEPVAALPRQPSKEEFRQRLRTRPPSKPDPAWKVDSQPGRWKGIVIHHTATDGGSPESIDRYHREERKWPNGLGYHFLIGNGQGMANGEVTASRRWLEQDKLDGSHLTMSEAAKTNIFHMPANSQGNSFTIGVALVGNFDNYLPTQEQLTSLKSLLIFLRQEYGIGLATIVGHGDVSAKPTDCPGHWFFVDEVILALANP